MSKLKLEVGKYYMDGEGVVVGPMVVNPSTTSILLSPLGVPYSPSGGYMRQYKPELNLLHEVTLTKVEPSAPKYRPYTFDEAVGCLLGKTIKSDLGIIEIVTILRLDDWSHQSKRVLEKYTFYPSGEPCGMLIED